jgi:hypothetical protein
MITAGPDNEPVKIVPISRIAHELPADQAVAALAMVMEELGLAQALAMMHGPERGARRYAEAGGHVRFDGNGEPVLLWKAQYARTQPGPSTEIPR